MSSSNIQNIDLNFKDEWGFPFITIGQGGGTALGNPLNPNGALANGDFEFEFITEQ